MRQRRPTAEVVVIILAIGISASLMVMTSAAIWVAVSPREPNFVPGLGENATQVLLAWGGGMLGAISAYVGYSFGRSDDDKFLK